MRLPGQAVGLPAQAQEVRHAGIVRPEPSRSQRVGRRPFGVLWLCRSHCTTLPGQMTHGNQARPARASIYGVLDIVLTRSTMNRRERFVGMRRPLSRHVIRLKA